MTEEKIQPQAISKLSVIPAEESLPLEQRMYFDRCMDFLVKMMEKYGGELKLPPTKIRISSTHSDDERLDAA